jgi:hypothetical protein
MAIGVIGDALTGQLISVVDGLKDTIRDAIGFADNAQKASLALGQTFSQTRVSLGGTMEGLRGDISQKFSASIAGMEAGLQGNTAGVARLINQQQLTGTNYQKTAAAFAKLEAGMNLSRDETNVLSNNLIETGAMYGVSTDKLVEAIDALKNTFPAQALAGMGSEVMEAVTLLQGELGGQLADPLNKVMQMVMDTSLEGYERLTKLGIGDLREQISNSDMDARGLRDVLKEALITADSSIRAMSEGSDNFFAQIGVTENVLGKGVLDITTVVQNFGKRSQQEADIAFEFGMSLDNLKNEAITPFKEAFILAYPGIVEGVNVISGMFNVLGEGFKSFAEEMGTEGAVRSAMKKFSLFIVNLTIDIVTFTKEKWHDLIRPGGALDSLKASFFRAAETFHDASQMFLFFGADTEAQIREDKAAAKAREIEARIRMHEFDPGVDLSKSPTLQSLIALRDSVETTNVFARKTNSSLDAAKESLLSIDSKTKNQNDSSAKDDFLKMTQRSLSRDMEALLGIGGAITLESLYDELVIANQQRALQAENEFGGGRPQQLFD